MDATAGGKDPFDLLMNAGSSPDIWFFVGGPLALLILLVALTAIVVVLRNRRERAALARDVEAESGVRHLTKGSARAPDAGHEAEDYETAPSYPIPPDLETETLSDDDDAEEAPAARKRDAEPGRPRPRLTVVPPPSSAAPGPSVEVEEVRRTDRASWLARLSGGLAKTRAALRGSLESLFTGKIRIDAGVLERLHEALYRADVGASTTDKLVDHVRETLGKAESADWESVSRALKTRAEALLNDPPAPPLSRPAGGPWVILVVGVNGVGKTTTISKLAALFLAEDRRVLLGAADTFRAAAIEQLSVWGERLGVDVIKHKQGSDPAAVAYDSVKAAIARKTDVLLIDTAGRLHAKTELMAELGKINRVIGKDLPGAPHETWLVVDATTGQNAVLQVKAFSEVVTLTGLIVTKLDGTAKGGVLLGIVDQFHLPVRYVGVGEKAADLRAFNAADYVESLF